MRGPSDSCSATRASLLARLQAVPSDDRSWSDFVDRYGPKIYCWSRNRGLPIVDAQDVTQQVLLKLAVRLRTFEYQREGSFRGWLYTITRNALTDYLADRAKRVDKAAGGDAVHDLLASAETRSDLLEQLSGAFDVELLNHAMKRVRDRVRPVRWRVFEMTALQGRSGKEVAEHLTVPVATVFTTKSQVQKLVYEEVQLLTGDDSSGPPVSRERD